MHDCLYHYRVVEVVSVFDADTARLVLDFGFKTYGERSCRLARINVPEIRDPDAATRAKAEQARNYLTARLSNAMSVGAEVLVRSVKLEKYGRALVELYIGDVNINDELVEKGYAVLYEAG